MSHLRSLHPQERRLLLACKAALRGLHEGPNATPRKAVFMGLGIHEATYSRWLNPELPDFPGIWDLNQIVNLTGDPAPYRALLAGVGEGFVVEVGGSAPVSESLGPQTLQHCLEVDFPLSIQLAKDLDDGLISAEEAAGTLPLAVERQRQAQALVDRLTAQAKQARRHA